MQRQALDAVEVEAIRKALSHPEVRSGLRKFFVNHEIEYTEKSRNQLNAVPENLHERAKYEALARQYAAWAKAWGTAWPELESLIHS